MVTAVAGFGFFILNAGMPMGAMKQKPLRGLRAL
jgi:hypothetical protein